MEEVDGADVEGRRHGDLRPAGGDALDEVERRLSVEEAGVDVCAG